MDPPMAKVDASGQIIPSPNLLKDLYLRTYQDRLSHRVMKAEYEDIFEIKSELWEILLEAYKSRTSQHWEMSDHDKVLKNQNKGCYWFNK